MGYVVKMALRMNALFYFDCFGHKEFKIIAFNGLWELYAVTRMGWDGWDWSPLRLLWLLARAHAVLIMIVLLVIIDYMTLMTNWETQFMKIIDMTWQWESDTVMYIASQLSNTPCFSDSSFCVLCLFEQEWKESWHETSNILKKWRHSLNPSKENNT